jgi:hypothetical protein
MNPRDWCPLSGNELREGNVSQPKQGVGHQRVITLDSLRVVSPIRAIAVGTSTFQESVLQFLPDRVRKA